MSILAIIDRLDRREDLFTQPVVLAAKVVADLGIGSAQQSSQKTAAVALFASCLFVQRLDRCEGHPFAYRRKRLLVDTGEARRRRVHVYVKDDAEQALPTEAYLGVIWRAYRRHGFDEHGLSLALGVER